MTETKKVKSVGNVVSFTDWTSIDLAWCPGAAAGQLWEITINDNTGDVISARRLK